MQVDQGGTLTVCKLVWDISVQFLSIREVINRHSWENLASQKASLDNNFTFQSQFPWVQAIKIIGLGNDYGLV